MRYSYFMRYNLYLKFIPFVTKTTRSVPNKTKSKGSKKADLRCRPSIIFAGSLGKTVMKKAFCKPAISHIYYQCSYEPAVKVRTTFIPEAKLSGLKERGIWVLKLRIVLVKTA